MSLYLDTSVLVAALTPEPNNREVQAWLGTQAAGALHISRWSITEFYAAIAVKNRIGSLTGQERHLASAANLIDRAANLHAGDALHLAIAQDQDLSLVSFDKAMLRAAMSLGIKAGSPLP